MLVYAKPTMLLTEKQEIPQQLMVQFSCHFRQWQYLRIKHADDCYDQDFVNEDNNAFAAEEEAWRGTKAKNDRDWDAEWRHVPESWPPDGAEDETYKDVQTTQAQQSQDNTTQKAKLIQSPNLAKNKVHIEDSGSHESLSDTLDASLNSETRHLEYASDDKYE